MSAGREMTRGRFLQLTGGALMLGACSEHIADPGEEEGSEVSISNFAFSPQNLTVSRGTTVEWTNRDAVTHTVTADNGSFDSGNLGPNGRYSRTFSTAGTFPYHCTPHPTMTGRIVVT
jgi:plastocyanin